MRRVRPRPAAAATRHPLPGLTERPQEFALLFNRVLTSQTQLRTAMWAACPRGHARLLNASCFAERSAAKDQFLRYIFHEMRVPLNAVSLAVEELSTAGYALPAAARSLIDIASFQARRGRDPRCGAPRA
jgi:signal transduction histidine kinase